MTLSSISHEPWESWYMWFLVPGVLTWIGGTIWWIRKRALRRPLAVQVFGSFEVVAGGGAAYMAGLVQTNSAMVDGGFWSPPLLLADQAFLAEVVVIAWCLHWLLLMATLAMAVLTVTAGSRGARPGPGT